MEQGTKQDILRHDFETAPLRLLYAADGHVCKLSIYTGWRTKCHTILSSH